jgi:O-antigen/teichoic acid export membrane protein
MQLQLSLQLGWTATLELIRQVSQTLVVVILVIAGASLLAFTGAQIPGVILATAIAALLVRHSSRLRPSFERQAWKHLTRELLPYAAASAIGAVYFRVEIVVLSLVSTGVQTGLFSTAFRITEVVVGIPWLVASSALPVIARSAEHDRDRLTYALRQMFDVSLTAGVGIAVAMFLGAQFAIAVVAGPKYRASVEVLQIQSITVAFTFLMTQWGFTLLALKRSRALLAINALGLATAIGLAVVLGSAYGANGASVALIGAEAVLAIGYALCLNRGDHNLSVRVRTAPRVALAAAAAIGVATVSSTSSLVATIIGVSVYLAVIAATGGLPAEVFELLPRRPR